MVYKMGFSIHRVRVEQFTEDEFTILECKERIILFLAKQKFSLNSKGFEQIELN